MFTTRVCVYIDISQKTQMFLKKPTFTDRDELQRPDTGRLPHSKHTIPCSSRIILRSTLLCLVYKR